MTNPNGNKRPDGPKMPMMNRQNLIFWIVIIFLLLLIYNISSWSSSSVKEVDFSMFYQMATGDRVVEVTFNEKDIYFTDQSGNSYHTYMPMYDPEIVRQLLEKGIQVSSQKPSEYMSIFMGWLPFIVFIGLLFYMMRSMQGGNARGAFSFSRSRAKLFVGGKTNTTFRDVAGVEEAKEELEEIIDFLKEPKKFQRLGGRIPKGVLLMGRPGTGKTLLAKAVAGEAGVPFFSISGSDFVELFVGVGASRVRDLFEQAKKHAPCITFIDEIDAVGRHRGTGLGGSHDEREQTLNQLLVEMDGFDRNDSVIVIAATNRHDVLDPALLRPGRFDRRVVVDLPDVKGRTAILGVHTRELPVSEDVNLNVIARGTPGFSGADLANLANEAALYAARMGKIKIEMSDFEEAKDKVVLGKERRSRVISDDEKQVTAYHEVGHLLCFIYQDRTDPVHKVTIIPRGFALGATMSLGSDRHKLTRSYLEQMITALLGGRIAEEMVFEDVSTGAGDDLERSTKLARRMVCRWGMSKAIGPITIGGNEDQVFLGKEITHKDHVSEQTAMTVDTEIHAIVMDAYARGQQILRDHREILDLLARELLEKETLYLDEIFRLILEKTPEDQQGPLQEKYRKAREMRFTTSTEGLGDSVPETPSGEDVT